MSSRRVIAGLIALIILTPAVVWGLNTVATGFKVANITTQIDAHGICKDVTATDGKTYFVPTKTPLEWTTFLAKKPATVTATDCLTVTPPTSPTLTLVTSFQCPNRYNRMFCGRSYTSKSAVTDDGQYIFAFEDGDSGLTQPKLHVYRVDVPNKKVTLVTSLTTGLSKYDQPTAGMAVTPDGKYVLLAARKYTGDGRTVPYYIYQFNGSSLSLVHSGQRQAYGYQAPAISDDASTFALDGRIYEKQGGSYQVVFDNGQSTTIASGDLGANLYLGSTNGYLIKKRGAMDWVTKDSSGIWSVQQTITPAGAGNVYGTNFAAVSHSRTMIALASKTSWGATYKADVYQLTGGSFKHVTTLNMSDNYQYAMSFSADGTYLQTSNRAWDITPALTGGNAVSVPTPLNGSIYSFSHVHESLSGLLVYIEPMVLNQQGQFTIYQRQ